MHYLRKSKSIYICINTRNQLLGTLKIRIPRANGERKEDEEKNKEKNGGASET